jgi:hypothetical protein
MKTIELFIFIEINLIVVAEPLLDPRIINGKKLA